MNFNNFNWHDSIIKNIIIDRKNPGVLDILEIEVVWPNNSGNVIKFKEVYWINIDMNLGINALDTILSANVTNSNEDLNNLYSKWKGLINDVELKCYTIITNTSGSTLKIIAKDFEIL